MIGLGVNSIDERRVKLSSDAAYLVPPNVPKLIGDQFRTACNGLNSAEGKLNRSPGKKNSAIDSRAKLTAAGMIAGLSLMHCSALALSALSWTNAVCLSRYQTKLTAEQTQKLLFSPISWDQFPPRTAIALTILVFTNDKSQVQAARRHADLAAKSFRDALNEAGGSVRTIEISYLAVHVLSGHSCGNENEVSVEILPRRAE